MSLKAEWEWPEREGLRRECEVRAAGQGYSLVDHGDGWSIVPITTVPASGRPAWSQAVASNMTLEEVWAWLTMARFRLARS